MTGEKMERVSRRRPCPICRKSDWCLAARDGSAAICARIEEGSVKRCGDAGWLHILRSDDRPRRRAVCRGRVVLPGSPGKDFKALAATYQDALTDGALAGVARELCVSSRSLKRLGIGWNGAGFTFPMRGRQGQIIGLRIRFSTGVKAAEKGGRNGLFIPEGLPPEGQLLVCEGESDTAAGLDLGFTAVGRPSCGCGAKVLSEFARGRDAVVVGDNDKAGRKGARALASALVLHCRTVRVVFPPEGVKDLRQWKSAGLTAQDLDAAARAAAVLEVRARGKLVGAKGDADHG